MPVTSKLDNLSTNPDERKEESIKAFIEVLGCFESEASFYLESSAWDIETALSLWFENNPSSNTLGGGGGLFSSPTWPGPVEANEGGWVKRGVVIEGLDPEWKASVSRSTGCIYFTHVPTGFRQSCVPPGFADNKKGKTSKTRAETGTGTGTGTGTERETETETETEIGMESKEKADKAKETEYDTSAFVKEGSVVMEDGVTRLTATENYSVFDIGFDKSEGNGFNTGSSSSSSSFTSSPFTSSSRPARHGSLGSLNDESHNPFYMIPPPTAALQNNPFVTLPDLDTAFASDMQVPETETTDSAMQNGCNGVPSEFPQNGF